MSRVDWKKKKEDEDPSGFIFQFGKPERFPSWRGFDVEFDITLFTDLNNVSFSQQTIHKLKLLSQYFIFSPIFLTLIEVHFDFSSDFKFDESFITISFHFLAEKAPPDIESFSRSFLSKSGNVEDFRKSLTFADVSLSCPHPYRLSVLPFPRDSGGRMPCGSAQQSRVVPFLH